MSAPAGSWASEGRLAEGVIVVGLGGNLGGPLAVKDRFDRAVDRLSRNWGQAQVSSLFVTAPVGEVKDQPDFLNAVAAWCPASACTPESALEALRMVEAEHGRSRMVPGGPRSLDLDLLLVGDEVRNDAELTLPHPRMGQRAFVLKPLLELFGADLRIGSSGPTVGQCLANEAVAAQIISRYL